MRNLCLHLEFDGTDFSGWQRQPAARTVQETLESAARELFGADINLIGAGRTDAGVHALDYVCNFRVESELETERVAAALNANLPEDIVVKRVLDVHHDFHSRYDAVARRYRYHLSSRRTAVRRRTRVWMRGALDTPAMARALEHVVGTHDFTSFTPAQSENGPVCTVHQATLDEGGDGEVTIDLEANRFLHHMVRVIVGTAVEIGRGRFDPEHMGEVMRKKDRRSAGPTAPAHGLFFVCARYPGA